MQPSLGLREHYINAESPAQTAEYGHEPRCMLLAAAVFTLTSSFLREDISTHKPYLVSPKPSVLHALVVNPTKPQRILGSVGNRKPDSRSPIMASQLCLSEEAWTWELPGMVQTSP